MTPLSHSGSLSETMSAIPKGMSKATFDAYINDKVTKFIESNSIDMRILNESLNSRVMGKPINHENVSYLSNNQNLPIKSNDGEVTYASVQIAKPEKQQEPVKVQNEVTYASVQIAKPEKQQKPVKVQNEATYASVQIAKPEKQQKPVKVQNEATIYSSIDFTKIAVNLGDEKKSIQGANGFGQVGVNGSKVTHATSQRMAPEIPPRTTSQRMAPEIPPRTTSQRMAPERPLPFPDKPLPATPRSSLGKFFDSIVNDFNRFLGRGGN